MNVKRPLTIDDILALEYIGDVQLSPDGTQVAYTLARTHTEDEHKLMASRIWIATTDGSSDPRQFTAGFHADSFPRWSPDSRQLAFLSDRDKPDTQQIYIIPLEGGEARQLTYAKAGVQSLSWSPDGQQIAFLAPDPESDDEEQRKQDKDDARHVDHDYKFTRLWVVNADGGEPRALTPPEYQVRSYTWRGNAAWVITSSPTPNEDDFNQSWPVQHVVEGRPAETIWQGQHLADWITSSLDGRWLAWRHSGVDREALIDEIWVLSPDGEAYAALNDMDGTLTSLAWMPNGEALLLTATAHTHSFAARLPATGGDLEMFLKGYTLIEGTCDTRGLSMSADGSSYACLIEDGQHPPDVWIAEPGREPRQLTHHNTRLAEVALGRTETICWQAPDGLEIEGVLIYPAEYQPGQRYPLIVHYHGGPDWQWREHFMASWHNWGQLLAAHGFAVLAPNPRGSTGRGRAFQRANRRAWGSGDLPDVLGGLDHVIALGIADPDRLGVCGWSYGGFLTAWTISHSDRFKAAIVGAGVTNLLSFQAADIPSWLPKQQILAAPWEDPAIYLACSPITYVGDVSTPTLILHGEDDPRVRLGQSYELYHALRYRGIPVEMIIYPREGHAINERQHQRDLLTRVCDWLDRYLN